ncbi:MAG TPA: phasin family protein [Candidatus Polarisedimenticolaceae bacterium]|nr:phasin family protein [Candidatus Polarisedimenticolaceae bacterium]
MATKKKSDALPSGGTAHRVWLAGLGALASAEAEGGKLFERLVERGREFSGQVGKPLEEATDRVRETMAGVRGRAGRTLKKVEGAFDQQLTAALKRLGVPTRTEVIDLTQRVEALNRKLDAAAQARPNEKKTGKKVTRKKKA